MAPNIVTAQTYSTVNVQQWNLALPAGVGDGYCLIIATNNGTLPAPPTSKTLLWTYGTTTLATLPNGEAGTITVYHAPFISYNTTQKNLGNSSGDTANITFTGVVDSAVACVMVVSGMGGLLFPAEIDLDRGVLNGPVFFVGNSISQPAPLSFSTVNYNDLSICINISDQGSLSNNCPNGYTGLTSVGIYGNNRLQMSIGYQAFTSLQNNYAWNWGVLSGFGTSALEYSYTDGTGNTAAAAVNRISPQLRKSKLISPVIGR